jgi:triacylglycerol lipase
LTCSRLQAPIVLAHGLFGFARIEVGPLTLAAYFRGIPEMLRAAGNRVLVTRVHPIAGIRRRGKKLGERIEAAFGDEPVHLIGHSMGGLDARVLLSDPAWSGRILSVTTIGTPHLGSPVADIARARVGRIYRLLERIGLDHRGFLDLIPRAARAFHEDTPAPDDVPCFSLAGDPHPEDVCWPLRRLHAAVAEREGANDGLVSVRSALAFGLALPPLPIDHFRQLNWFLPAPAGPVRRRALALYSGVVENLAGCGFGTAERALPYPGAPGGPDTAEDYPLGEGSGQFPTSFSESWAG